MRSKSIGDPLPLSFGPFSNPWSGKCRGWHITSYQAEWEASGMPVQELGGLGLAWVWICAKDILWIE